MKHCPKCNAKLTDKGFDMGLCWYCGNTFCNLLVVLPNAVATVTGCPRDVNDCGMTLPELLEPKPVSDEMVEVAYRHAEEYERRRA